MKRFFVLAAVALVATAAPLSAASPALPEAVTTSQEMVVTANPIATRAAARVLANGGTAVDAMVVAQTMLGLVEPQSSGIGGGAFVVYYDAATDTLTTFDAREKAPMAATEDRFAGLGFFSAWQSGLSVGVPGVPALFEEMHERYGEWRWNRLFIPAMVRSLRGFALTERTSSQVAGLLSFNPSCEDRLFFRDPTALAYFADPETCTAKPAGTEITNIPYFRTMLRMSNKGADGFYRGPIGRAIVEAVTTDPNIPGDMTMRDMRRYEVVEREPVCVDYRSHDVCGMGPPSSGGLTVGQILGILDNFDLGDDPLGEDYVHLFTQAGRLAFADRGRYMADSDFVDVPVAGLLDEEYLESRAELIGTDDMGTAAPGTPPGVVAPGAPDATVTDTGTSHISIVDRWGNALSMTTSVESSLGNGVMVHGFLLNNQLTDFAFDPVGSDGSPVANRVQPGKRPRSSMSPTIVLNGDGEVELVTGSPGGSRIIGYTAQSVVNVVDFGLDPQQAINVPHVMNRNGRTDIEAPIPGVTSDYDADALAAALEARGHTVGIIQQTSGLSIIQVTDDGLVGGADQRRDGRVGGR